MADMTDKQQRKRPKFQVVRYLRLFTLLAGCTWAITLLFMLFWWIARGQPNYPTRGNEDIHVPYVSDVAAFTAKPAFQIGTAVSAVFYVATIVSLHYVRYDPRFHGRSESEHARHGRAWWRSRIASACSIACVLASAISLVLLAYYDTYRYPTAHAILLVVLVFSTVVGVGCANVVYYEQIGAGGTDMLLKYSVLTGNLIILIIAALGIPFIVLKWTGHDRPAVILEWIMGLLFAGYFWSLVGVLGPIRFIEEETGETTPLLHAPAAEN